MNKPRTKRLSYGFLIDNVSPLTADAKLFQKMPFMTFTEKKNAMGFGTRSGGASSMFGEKLRRKDSDSDSDSDSGTSTCSSDSPKKRKGSKRKGSSLAGKAMSLARKKGISLKQAWKLVKKGKGAKRTIKVKGTRKSSVGEAMKLAHKKGISLKKAWALIRKKRRCSRAKNHRSAFGSAKQRKAQKTAAKAMKLAYKDGISLKEAWDQIRAL